MQRICDALAILDDKKYCHRMYKLSDDNVIVIKYIT